MPLLCDPRPGFGVDQLRDDNLETYWQSDGSQPHLVNIQFRYHEYCMYSKWAHMWVSSFNLCFYILCRRRTTVKMLCIYADYKSDESYTPSKISVRVGNNFHNLQEIRVLCVVLPWSHKCGSCWSNFSFSFCFTFSLQQLEMVEPSGWIHISLINQVRSFSHIWGGLQKSVRFWKEMDGTY